MARVLVFNIPAAGHINVTLPVVEELLRRGHEVTYSCTEETRATIERTGATFLPYPASADAMGTTGTSVRLSQLGPLLLRYAHDLVPFARAEIDRLGPDVVVHDGMAVWAAIAAHLAGAPTVATYPTPVLAGAQLDLGLRNKVSLALDLLRTMPAAKREVAALTERYGADAMPKPLIPTIGQRNIVFAGPVWHPPSSVVDDRFALVGPSIDARTRPAGDWSAPTGAGPLVYVSLGTVNNRSIAFYREVLRAYAEVPARFVLYAGRGVDLAPLAPYPANFLVTDDVPQLRILEEADVFVTHGGMNSVQEALYNAVPMVLVPQQFEQLIISQRVAELGAGVVLGGQPPYGRVKARHLRPALERLLGDPAFRTSAERLRDDARGAGGYERAADEIESMLPARG